MSIKLFSLFYTYLRAKGCVELSVFAFCIYNGGGLMEGWVDEGRGYVVAVCIEMEA